MVLTDQQLRQDLINFGETVPPITQRNREQLRARLELLQSLKTVRGRTDSPSKSRSRVTASPSKFNTTSSPSRTRATASPSKSHATSSPSRTRAAAAAASPARSNVPGSPSRTRTTATGSGRTTRSKQTPNLIELSDSEAESTSTGVLMSRSTRSGQTAPHAQTRSIPLRSRNDSPTKTETSPVGPGGMTDDVEQSIARHRREIKQLLDSARDRNRTTNTSSPTRSGRQSSPSSASKSRTRRASSKSESEETSSKSPTKSRKKFSKLKNLSKPIHSFWKKYLNAIKNLFKILLFSSLALGGLYIYLYKPNFGFAKQEEISCSVENATKCEDMKPVIAAVRKQLQVRTGEVDCGFRPKADILVNRTEVERFLNERGLKFRAGDNVRWRALLTYIIETPIQDIVLWNAANQPTKSIPEVTKLSTTEAVRSLTCRARQDISKNTLRNIILLILGSTGMFTLARYFQKNAKTHDDNERTFKDYFEGAKDLIQESYEKYIENPKSQPLLVINHIRDKLIPVEDRERLAHIWERVKNEISKQDTRLRAELHEIDGKRLDVWKWIKSAASSPQKKTNKPQASNDDDAPSSEVGLTECLKVRNCFRSDNSADDEEIDQVVDGIQARCVNIKRIEHIGIHSVFVYLKFSSKEAAAEGYHLLNNWKFQGRNLNVKYIRLNRYYEHFPEAKDASLED